MKAIILAAGKGSRLRGVAGNKPKCLASVGGLSLIERQISALRASGIYEIVVVVGFQADSVRTVCGPDVDYIENPVFFRTSSLYSLWLARHAFDDGFVVLNSDVLFHDQLLSDLLASRYEDALLIAYQDRTMPPLLGAEEMKIRVRAGRVVDISKEIDPTKADGENLGIVKFGRAGAAILRTQIDMLIGKGGVFAWAPRAFREFARVRPLYAIGTRGLPWIEIDFPEDYRRAIEDVLPAIEADRSSFAVPSMLASAAAASEFKLTEWD